MRNASGLQPSLAGLKFRFKDTTVYPKVAAFVIIYRYSIFFFSLNSNLEMSVFFSPTCDGAVARAKQCVMLSRALNVTAHKQIDSQRAAPAARCHVLLNEALSVLSSRCNIGNSMKISSSRQTDRKPSVFHKKRTASYYLVGRSVMHSKYRDFNLKKNHLACFLTSRQAERHSDE